MDLSHSLIDAVIKSSFACTTERQRSDLAKQHIVDNPALPGLSSLSPSLNLHQQGFNEHSATGHVSKWRVDGATLCGTQFYVVPTYLLPDLVPRRIDVFIPDQQYHPKHMRHELQSSLAVCLRDGHTIAGLGISRHLCRALDYHCEVRTGFWDEYQRLPFGSKLVFEEITADVRQMRLSVVPAHHLEMQALSVTALQTLWQEIPEASWPESIDIERLRLKRELQDSISVVGILDDSGRGIQKDYIFKTSASEFKCLYHELHFLLTSPPHPNIMHCPLSLVTKKSNFGGKRGVYGFILPFYPTGSIRDILPARTVAGTLALEQRLKWARQVTSALVHINEEAGTFYSDLRPDNVLLASGAVEDIILCDFEQRGNWHEWCAPEILYRIYLENLRTDAPPSHPWTDLIARFSPGASADIPADKWIAAHVPHGRNAPWFALSPAAQEAAQVYTLGLLIYCIFEGVSNPRPSIANAWPKEPNMAFPAFTERSPHRVRELVRQCTEGAREWVDEGEKMVIVRGPVVRVEDKVYPPAAIASGSDWLPRREERREEEVARDERFGERVVEAAREWWLEELERARRFLNDESSGDQKIKRPTLRKVLAVLEDGDTIRVW